MKKNSFLDIIIFIIKYFLFKTQIKALLILLYHLFILIFFLLKNNSNNVKHFNK